MSQLGLFDFDKTESFDFNFESDWIKQFSMETGEIFSYKTLLTSKRIPKKDKVVFVIHLECIHKENPECDFFDEQEFKTKENAVDFFEARKMEAQFFVEKNKENKIFDGQRYMLKLNEEGKIIGRGWW